MLCAPVEGLEARRSRRHHRRFGDAARIAGYVGSGSSFDAAVADFALAYAVQVESDWRQFVAAIKSGVIEARNE